jgi:hypothetical protein
MPAKDSAPPSADPPFKVPRSKSWPGVVFVLLVVGVALFFFIRAARAPKPQRVLVAIDVDGYWWTGSETSALVSDKLGAELSKLGFDVVKGGDPEAAKVLEKAPTLQEASRVLQAGFLAETKIVPEVIEHDIGGGYVELRVDAKIMLTFYGEPPREVGRVLSYAGAPTKKQAQKILATSLSSQILDAIVSPMIRHPKLKEIVDQRATNEGAELAPAVAWADRVDALMKKTNEAYADVRDKRIGAERGKPKPTFLSAPMAHDELAGVGKKGWLASTNDIRPLYVTDLDDVGYLTQLDSLEWRSLESPGNPGETLWRGYNAFGYPSAQDDHAVLVEDLFGGAKVITVVDAAGAKPRAVKSDDQHRYVDPKLSPGGKFIAVWDRPCASCASDLLVLAADTGAVVLHADRENGSFGGLAWLDDHHLLFLHATSGDDADAKMLVAPKPNDKDKKKTDVDAIASTSRLSIWTLDCAASPASLAAPVAAPVDVALGMPALDATSGIVVFASSGGTLATFDPKSGAFGSIAVDGTAAWPTVSPDGKLVAFELRDASSYQPEIAIVDIHGGPTKKLTDNDAEDGHPLFTADGRFVVYETVEDDPAFGKERTLVWVASVPVPP